MTWHSKNVAHKFVQLFKERASRPVLFLILLPFVLNLKTQKHILCETALIVQESLVNITLNVCVDVLPLK